MARQRVGALDGGIRQAIVFVRGQRVILDADAAALYGVPTGALVQAVRRNFSRFPEDVMFQLTSDEAVALRSQSVISEDKAIPGYRFLVTNPDRLGGKATIAGTRFSLSFILACLA